MFAFQTAHTDPDVMSALTKCTGQTIKLFAAIAGEANEISEDQFIYSLTRAELVPVIVSRKQVRSWIKAFRIIKPSIFNTPNTIDMEGFSNILAGFALSLVWNEDVLKEWMGNSWNVAQTPSDMKRLLVCLFISLVTYKYEKSGSESKSGDDEDQGAGLNCLNAGVKKPIRGLFTYPITPGSLRLVYRQTDDLSYDLVRTLAEEKMFKHLATQIKAIFESMAVDPDKKYITAATLVDALTSAGLIPTYISQDLVNSDLMFWAQMLGDKSPWVPNEGFEVLIPSNQPTSTYPITTFPYILIGLVWRLYWDYEVLATVLQGFDSLKWTVFFALQVCFLVQWLHVATTQKRVPKYTDIIPKVCSRNERISPGPLGRIPFVETATFQTGLDDSPANAVPENPAALAGAGAAAVQHPPPSRQPMAPHPLPTPPRAPSPPTRQPCSVCE